MLLHEDRNAAGSKLISASATLAEKLLNLPDYIFNEDPRPTLSPPYPTVKQYRENHAWRQEPFYEYICDFANAWKHRRISRDGRKISNISDVQEIVGICRYVDEAGEYYRSRKYIFAKLVDGNLIDMREMLTKSLEFWGRELFSINILDSIPFSPSYKDPHIERLNPLYKKPLILHAINGENDFSPTVQAFRFDYQTGILQPAQDKNFNGEANLEILVHRSPLSKRKKTILKRLYVTVSANSKR